MLVSNFFLFFLLLLAESLCFFFSETKEKGFLCTESKERTQAERKNRNSLSLLSPLFLSSVFHLKPFIFVGVLVCPKLSFSTLLYIVVFLLSSSIVFRVFVCSSLSSLFPPWPFFCRSLHFLPPSISFLSSSWIALASCLYSAGGSISRTTSATFVFFWRTRSDSQLKMIHL